MINKVLTLPPLEKILRTPMNDRAFSLSFFRAFTQYELFVSFRSLNFGFKINRINPLLVIISSKLPAITNGIHRLLLWMLQTRDVAGRKFLSSARTAPKVSVLCSHRVRICCGFPCPRPHCTAPPHTFRVLTPPTSAQIV